MRALAGRTGGGPGVGAVYELGGGDGADGQGGYDQNGVPGDRGGEPDLDSSSPRQPADRSKAERHDGIRYGTADSLPTCRDPCFSMSKPSA